MEKLYCKKIYKKMEVPDKPGNPGKKLKESLNVDEKCNLCGGPLKVGLTCRERFERCLALEYEHPGTYGAVHHLTVPCYMLQHFEYSRDAWSQARQLLFQFLRKKKSPQEILKLSQVKYQKRYRKWRVDGGERTTEFDKIRWSRTIADIRLDSPEVYAGDVMAWADSVLRDTEFMF